jgi:hypothetical protein
VPHSPDAPRSEIQLRFKRFAEVRTGERDPLGPRGWRRIATNVAAMCGTRDCTAIPAAHVPNLTSRL